VDKVTQCIGHVVSISQVFSAGALSKILTIIERLEARVQGQYIHLGSTQENEQLQAMLGQKLQERLDAVVAPADKSNQPEHTGEYSHSSCSIFFSPYAAISEFEKGRWGFHLSK
jgi:hypothetical protein